MNGDRLMYFQHTDISRVVFEGYVDDACKYGSFLDFKL